ncbi:Predicted arabinose efflux permease, MFS family [Microbulbifer donghaiensis]|uniref:Predicted arabinose efflux permease, MFS family n=1 Tax=Microbulbifer donghaiensis TaxID=494016 RepID=A0A1M5G7Z7_9GAMM|nr:MFS transporter [Microbulbifer donghaiensis]SHF99859.1 Predicted arabinose efflux permease, MFS family [Microbulbifer donghaiensis]
MNRQWWQQLHSFPPLIWIILIGSFFGRGTYFMVWPFLAILLYEKFQLGAAQIGLILSASAVGAALLGFYVGSLSDRYGRRNMLLAGTTINVLAFALLAVAQSLPVFIAAMTFCSIGRAVWEPPASALIGDLIPDKQSRELALQFRYFLINVGAALGPIVGVWAGLSAQQSTFGLTALSYLLLSLAFLWGFAHTESGRLAHKRRNANVTLASTLAVLRRDQVFLVVIIANVLTLFIYAHLDSSLVQYLTRAGAPRLVELISSMILVNASTIVLLQFPLLQLMRNIDVNGRIIIGLVVLAVGQLWFALNPVNWFVGWLGATFVVSLAEAVLFPTMSVQIDRLAPDHLRGSYFGASSFYSLGWSVAPLIGGIVIEWWSGAALYWMMFCLCGMVFVLYRLTAHLTRPEWPESSEAVELRPDATPAQ